MIFQWGHNAKDNKTIIFPISFSDISYCFIEGLNYGGGNAVWYEFIVSDKDLNSSECRTISTQMVGTRIGAWIALGV